MTAQKWEPLKTGLLRFLPVWLGDRKRALAPAFAEQFVGIECRGADGANVTVNIVFQRRIQMGVAGILFLHREHGDVASPLRQILGHL